MTATVLDDDNAICAAYLHDVLEDTDITEQQMRNRFGDTITDFVVELTNVSKGFLNKDGSRPPRRERKRMDLEHISKISTTAKIIKLIDRYDNINDNKGCEEANEFLKSVYLRESHELWLVLIQDQEVLNADREIGLGETISWMSDSFGIALRT